MTTHVQPLAAHWRGVLSRATARISSAVSRLRARGVTVTLPPNQSVVTSKQIAARLESAVATDDAAERAAHVEAAVDAAGPRPAVAVTQSRPLAAAAPVSTVATAPRAVATTPAAVTPTSGAARDGLAILAALDVVQDAGQRQVLVDGYLADGFRLGAPLLCRLSDAELCALHLRSDDAGRRAITSYCYRRLFGPGAARN